MLIYALAAFQRVGLLRACQLQYGDSSYALGLLRVVRKSRGPLSVVSIRISMCTSLLRSTSNGGLLGVRSFPTTPAGYHALSAWLGSFGTARPGRSGGHRHLRCGPGPPPRSVGDRGDRGRSSQPSGASPQRQVRRARRDRGGTCRAVGTSAWPRQGRHRHRRSATRVAGREALGAFDPDQDHRPAPAPGHHRTRRSACAAQRAHHQSVDQPKPPRLRPGTGSDPVRHATKTAIVTLARRVQAINAEIAALDRQVDRPRASDRTRNCSTSTASASTPPRSCSSPPATTPQRIHSEAAWAHLCGVAPIPAGSGKTNKRRRLNPGGNRQANHALWRIVLTRLGQGEPRTVAYMQRRLAAGRTKPEIIRSLKRYVAREIYQQLPR